MQLAGCDGRLGQVVQDERQAGQRSYGVDGGGQLVRQGQQVVDEPGTGHRAQAPPHVRARQPAWVRLTLHQMADAHQVRAAGTRTQRIECLRKAAGREVGPADHPGDRARRAHQGQELGRLGRAGEHLDEDRPVDSGRCGERGEIGNGEVSADGGHPGVVQPRMRPPVKLPDVMVRVDPHHVPPAMACEVEQGGYTRPFGSEMVVPNYGPTLPNGAA
jgi:hypothetical protein